MGWGVRAGGGREVYGWEVSEGGERDSCDWWGGHKVTDTDSDI